MTDTGAATPRKTSAIFVSVGSQMPFDRLVAAVDRWAVERGRVDDVLAQIGADGQPPEHVRWVHDLTPEEFERHVAEADLLVSHAGMGTILTALRHAKPVIVFPRRGDRRETRNDHQLATIDRFRGRAGVYPALDEAELVATLDRGADLGGGAAISDHASDELLRTIRAFIDA